MRKPQKREEYRGMNELPDEVLILILSHMPMKAAATTSVLSRRWKKLWTFHPSLVFDGSKELLNLDYHLRGLPTDDYTKKKECLDSERVKYIHWVNHILESHHAPAAIQEFKIRFDLNKHYQSDIDEWVRFAFGKQVKIFELDFADDLGRIHGEEEASYYKLCTHTLGLLQTPISLTSLVLKQVNVSGEVVENLISNSPFLERLCVVGSESLVHLRVAAPSLCLTHLKVVSCIKLKGLELNAPNLVSLIYSGPSIKIRFTKDPLNLTELCMGGSYVENCICNNMLPLVPRFASQLQKLGIMMYADEIGMQRLEYPIMNQVKKLEVKVIVFDHDSLLFLSSLIEACPCLNHFALEITAWLKSDRRREAKKVKSHHDKLKEVEITGFVGRRVDTEFCKYLIKSAVRLERMIINPLPSYIKGTAYVNDEPKTVRAARKKAEKLGSKYGLEDKLVIL